MAKSPRTFEAFISYSHAADTVLAAQLQRTLNRIARPPYKWWTWWPPRVFRDQTNLPPGGLSAEIERALRASESFVLLASPRAAQSEWVDQEAATWRREKSVDRLYLALTEGTLEWDDARGDFDRERTTALPPSLYGAFGAEPKWVDFSAVREDRPFVRDPVFVDGAATLAAAIRGVDKDALVGEDVRQRRRVRQLAVGAIATVTLLAVAASIAAVAAYVQRNRAIDRERLALSRQFAAQSVTALDLDPERSLVLASRAASTAPTEEADSALRRALRTSRLRALVDAGAAVRDVDGAANGSVVAGALANGEVRVWDASTRRLRRTFTLDTGPALAVALSGDGARVAGAGQRQLVVWETASTDGVVRARITAEDPLLSAALSPNGELAATGHRGGVVRLWRVDGGALERELRPPGAPEPITAIAFAPDGRSVAAAAGKRALVWSTEPGRRPIVLPHDAAVLALAFGASGRVATGDDKGFVRVWDPRTRRAALLVGHEGRVGSIAFAPDASLLVSGGDDEVARIWDVPVGGATASARAELRGHTGLVNGVAFAAGASAIVTGGSDRELRFWATAADPIRAELAAPGDPAVKDVAFDRSGTRVAVGTADGTARVWTLGSRDPAVLEHGTARDWVVAVEFAASGLFVTAATDGTLRIWENASAPPRATLGEVGAPALTDADVSPDGELAVAGDAEGTVRVWRVRDGDAVATLRTPAPQVNAVAFASDGRHMAVAAGRAVRVWRVGAWASPVAVLRDPGRLTQNELWSVAFAPGGGLVAAGDLSGWWTVWDVGRARVVARAKAARDAVADVAFSADGTYLATADWLGGARVWTAASGGLVTATRTRSPLLEAAAFGPHARLVAVGGDGGTTTVFECAECRPLRELVCLAEQRVTPAVRSAAREAFAACD